MPLAVTLDGCERILAGEFADRPESDFYMLGGLDEISLTEKSGGAIDAYEAKLAAERPWLQPALTE